jgi:di/tricarboxylate transporter
VTDATLSLLILGGCVALFVWNRLPVGVVAILTALALYFTGLVDAQTMLAGFGDPVVIFIATLFVVSEGLDAAGVTAWVGQLLTRHAGTRRSRLLPAVMLLAAVISALITPNGAAAALLPVTVAVARAAGLLPSRMLVPLAYAASAGALLTLSGSPVNVIVDEASQTAGGPGFGFFEFALVGIPLVLGTVAVALLLGEKVLPARTSTDLPADLSGYGADMARHYGLDQGIYRLRVRQGSDLVGAVCPDMAGAGLVAIGIQDTARQSVGLTHLLSRGDVLVVSGPPERVRAFAAAHRLKIAKTLLDGRSRAEMITREVGIAEVVIPPRSPLIGTTAFPGMARDGGLLVLAIRRLGRDRGLARTELAEGDSLLVHGGWPVIESLSTNRSVLVVDSPEMVRRQTVALGKRAPQAIAIVAGMVVLLASGVVPPAIGGLIAATAMVALRVLDAPAAYRAVSWQTVVLIGGLIPLSVAIQTSGAADLIADGLVGLIGDAGPYPLLIALFLLTGALGQIISNTATVLIVVPIAVAAAAETGISVQTVLMLVAVAGAASLLTPIATPANMIVMGPGGYRFGDYVRLGLPTMLVWLVVAVGLVPLLWPLGG